MILGSQLGGAVLQLGGPQTPISGVILPVHVGTAVTEGGHLCLNHSGICAGIGIEGLFNVDDEGLAALFAEGQGNQLFSVEHAAPQEPRLVRHGHHLFGEFQLRHGLAAAVLGKFRFEIDPELLDGLGVLFDAEGTEFRIGPLGVELFDMVPLAGIPPPGEELEVLLVVQVVPPGADVAHPHIRIPGQQYRGFFLRHDGDLRLNTRFHAVGFNGGQSRVLIPLRSGHRIIEGHPSLAFAPDDQAACRLRPGITQRAPPHELDTGGVFA